MNMKGNTSKSHIHVQKIKRKKHKNTHLQILSITLVACRWKKYQNFISICFPCQQEATSTCLHLNSTAAAITFRSLGGVVWYFYNWSWKYTRTIWHDHKINCKTKILAYSATPTSYCLVNCSQLYGHKAPDTLFTFGSSTAEEKDIVRLSMTPSWSGSKH